MSSSQHNQHDSENEREQSFVGSEGLIASVERAPTGEIRSGKLAGRGLWSSIIILAMPVFLQQTMQACVGLFDKVIAGALPDEAIRVPAMDGLGIGSYIGWFIMIAMAGLGIGGQAIIARAIGAGRLQESQLALAQAMALAAAWGALVAAVLWFVAPVFGWMCQLTPEATMFCNQYVRAVAISLPLCGVMQVGAYCMHGAGETVMPSIIAIGVNIVNIVASWVLSGANIRWGESVISNPFTFDLNVIGIGLGTAISYILGGVFTAWVLLRGVKDLRLDIGQMKLHSTMIRRIVRVGIPNFFEGISMWGVNLFVLMIIGVIAVRTAQEGLQGAHVIAVQWEAFSFMPGFAIGTAAGALAGQYLGAGNARMAQKAVLTCTALGIGVMVSCGIVLMLFGRQLTGLVSTEQIHLDYTPTLLLICGAAQVFFAITMVVRQGLRGVGDTKWTLLITTLSSYGVRLPLVFVLGVSLDFGLKGVWFGLCGEFIARAAMFSARFLHGGWKSLDV